MVPQKSGGSAWRWRGEFARAHWAKRSLRMKGFQLRGPMWFLGRTTVFHKVLGTQRLLPVVSSTKNYHRFMKFPSSFRSSIRPDAVAFCGRQRGSLLPQGIPHSNPRNLWIRYLLPCRCDWIKGLRKGDTPGYLDQPYINPRVLLRVELCPWEFMCWNPNPK